MVILAAGSSLIVACQRNPEPEEPTSTLEPTPTETIEVIQTEAEPDASEEEEPTNECLVCHVDKQQLIDTAKQEEEVISENEGQG